MSCVVNKNMFQNDSPCRPHCARRVGRLMSPPKDSKWIFLGNSVPYIYIYRRMGGDVYIHETAHGKQNRRYKFILFFFCFHLSPQLESVYATTEESEEQSHDTDSSRERDEGDETKLK